MSVYFGQNTLRIPTITHSPALKAAKGKVPNPKPYKLVLSAYNLICKATIEEFVGQIVRGRAR